MNTEAIIELLLLSGDAQLLSTPLEVLALSTRVHQSLWRAGVRTVGEVAHAWSHILKIRNFGEGARDETLQALETWFLSFPEAPTPDPVETKEPQTDLPNLEDVEHLGQVPGLGLDPQLPIEVLHLSQRTYRALRRNQIQTIDDIRQEFHRIRTFRNVGPVALNEIHKALEETRPPRSLRTRRS